MKEEAINTSNNYTNEVKKELSASIEVTAESITNKVNGLDNKYTEIKQTVDSIDLTGKVNFTDLETTGKTTIHGGNIKTGTITADKLKAGTITSNEIATGTITANDIASNAITADKIASNAITADKIASKTITVDKISSNNENPIITLFGGCAIDATSSGNKGQGSSIRFKWDNYDYLKIGSDVFDIYTWSGGSSPTFRLYGGPHTQTIKTQAGTITINSQGLKWNDTNVSLNGHTHTNYATTSSLTTTTNTANTAKSTADSAKSTANTAKSTANTALSKANSAYNLADSKVSKSSSSGFKSGSHDPYSSDIYNLGWSSYRWQQCTAKYIYATNTYSLAIDNPVATVSDNSVDDVLDDIIIESPNIMRMSDTEGLNEKLVINVNALKENKNAHLFVSEDDAGKVVVNESSLLALALLEIQKLKQEIKDIKGGAFNA